MFDSWKLSGPRLLGVALSFLMTWAASAQSIRVREVQYTGRLPVSRNTASKMAELAPGGVCNPQAIQAAADRLIAGLRRQDYPMAAVLYDVRDAGNRKGATVVFSVDAGPCGRLKEVRFTGRKAVPVASLKPALSVLPSKRGFRQRLAGGGYFDVDKLAADQQALQDRYFELGYLDAQVGMAQVEWVKELDGFRVTWPILQEGPAYVLGAIQFKADQLPTDPQLAGLMRMRPGEPLGLSRAQAARARLEQFYLLQGHAFASVKVDIDKHPESARADLLYTIHSGLIPRLRNIQITGTRVTADEIVRREVPLKPGDPFDYRALQLADARLQALPLFSEVKVVSKGSADSPSFDVAVDVKEKKTGRLDVGYVYGEMEGGAVQVMVRQMNLALVPPFRGHAVEGRIGATMGSNITRLEGGLTNPRVLSSNWSADGSVFYEDNKYVSDYYDQSSLGGSLLTAHPLGRHQSFSTGYLYTDYALENMDPEYAATLGPYSSDVMLTSWLLAWSLDTTDQRFRPTRGVRARVSLELGNELLGGDTDVVQTSAEVTFYANPVGEHVISLRGSIKNVEPYGVTDSVALPLRLYLGGSYDLRGFEYRTVAPVNDTQDLIGGESAWFATLQYLLPVHPRVDVALYADMGDVGETAYQLTGVGPVSDWGIGVLVRAENFPVRFDAAFPIQTYDGDMYNESGKLQLSFSVGYRF